jgi:hypothetical protein
MSNLTIHLHNCEANFAFAPIPEPGSIEPLSVELAEGPSLLDTAAAVFRATRDAGARGVKVRPDGTLVLEGEECSDFMAILFPDTGWMVAVATQTDNGKAFDSQQAAEEAMRKLDLLGHDDWQLAPLEVWERHVLNRKRHNPAVHVDLFPNLRTDDWYWTADTCVWSVDESTGVAASAWYVYAGYGNVDDYRRNYSGFALAARRAGQ